MSRKTHEKNLARARAKREAQQQATRRRNLVIAVVGGVAVILVVLWATGVFGGDDPVVAASETPASTVAPTPSEQASAPAGGFEPCPVPTDAPTADTSLQFDAPPPADEVAETVTATIQTTCGDIVVELDGANAPQTVANFLFLAEQGYYTGTPFHRVMADFVIQGGDPTGTGTGGPGYTFEDELDHVATVFEEVAAPCAGAPEGPCYAYPRGTLAMANSGANTNGSQFFVVQADPHNAWPAAYTPFGTVVEGMDVVDRIANGEVTGPSGDQAVDPTVVTGISTSDT